MPTKKELIDKIKKEKLISKGLTKLSKKELEEFASKGMHSSDMLKKAGNMVKSKRLKMLKLMTKKKLLKLISTIRIKNYSNLSQKELIEVIATKHWGDFHSKWVTASKSDKSLLPNYHPKELEDKPEKLDRTLKGKVIKPQIAEVQEIKKRGPQKAPPKRPVKEVDEGKHDDDYIIEPDDDTPLELKNYLETIIKYKNYTIKDLGEILPKELRDTYEYISTSTTHNLKKYKGNKKSLLRIISKIKKKMKKVLEDDKKCLTSRQKQMLKEATHHLSYYLDKSNLDKNRKKRIEDVNMKLDYVYTLMKKIDGGKCKDTKLYKDFRKVYDKIHNTDKVKNGVWKTIWKDLNVIHPSKGPLNEQPKTKPKTKAKPKTKTKK